MIRLRSALNDLTAHAWLGCIVGNEVGQIVEMTFDEVGSPTTRAARSCAPGLRLCATRMCADEVHHAFGVIGTSLDKGWRSPAKLFESGPDNSKRIVHLRANACVDAAAGILSPPVSIVGFHSSVHAAAVFLNKCFAFT